jgi:hypothetical protein
MLGDAGRSRRSLNGVMNGVKDAISDETAFGPRHAGVGRTPIFIICSPSPRVGKSLIARLLTEFFCFNGQSVVAFDANPNDPSLSHYLPDCTVAAAIGDTKSQMVLFDRLIVNDARPKVIDLAAGLFDPFFALIQDIGFVEEAPKQLVRPVVLFVTDRHRLSIEAYEMVWRRFPNMILVPVHNEAIITTWDGDRFPTRRANGVPLRIPRLPRMLNAVINRNSFSFTEFLYTSVNFPTEVHEWINRCFISFRELQLCILMEDFRPLFNRQRTHRLGN